MGLMLLTKAATIAEKQALLRQIYLIRTACVKRNFIVGHYTQFEENANKLNEKEEKESKESTPHHTSESDIDAREPVESVLQRILEPHQKSQTIGLSKKVHPNEGSLPLSTPSSREQVSDLQQGINDNSCFALVPLNVIYLPPPAWHKPLQPLYNIDRARLRKLSKQRSALDNIEAANNPIIHDPNINKRSQSDTSEYSISKLKDTTLQRHSIVRDYISNIKIILKSALSTVKQPSHKKMPASKSEKEAIEEKDIKENDDNEKKARAVKDANGGLWQGSPLLHRVIKNGQKRIDALKALPKDDDWVTWAGKALNQVTGYDRISQLKEQVEDSSSEFKKARELLDFSKAGYTKAVHERLAAQREINGLLQRKHLWNEDDVARFTSLYKKEHQSELLEKEAGAKTKDMEKLVDTKYDELVGAIRERYHEEQIWSDKIRRASTYGTWAVLFMNILALFLAQAIFEPRKRRKIIAGVEERLGKSIDEQRDEVTQIHESLESKLAAQGNAISLLASHINQSTMILNQINERQAAELESISAQFLNSAIDSSNDTELDMYTSIEQQNSMNKRQGMSMNPLRWSMIWQAITGKNQRDKNDGQDANKPIPLAQGEIATGSSTQPPVSYTSNEARQLAFESAILTGTMAAILAYYYSTH